eukprot:evm.model.scf_77.3 EVM.evm.TU.scf_77.3   scf_77:65620-66331(+)
MHSCICKPGKAEREKVAGGRGLVGGEIADVRSVDPNPVRQHQSTMDKADQATSPKTPTFQELCNSASLFDDFGHFYAKDAGYEGAQHKWTITAQSKAATVKEDKFPHYEVWYSA